MYLLPNFFNLELELDLDLIHHEDQVDDDVEERLAEDHEGDERQAQEAAEQLGTQRRAAELRTQHKRIPGELEAPHGGRAERVTVGLGAAGASSHHDCLVLGPDLHTEVSLSSIK
jgi:hypothetical protein